jgi:hypothetical protein
MWRLAWLDAYGDGVGAVAAARSAGAVRPDRPLLVR